MDIQSKMKNFNSKNQTSSEKFELSHPVKKKKNIISCLRQRHVVTVFGFLNFFLMTAIRLVIGVGIVAMVKHRQTNDPLNSTEIEISCPLPSAELETPDESIFQGEFEWSSELQGCLLGAGFLSYLIMLVPGGRLADAGESKRQLVVSNAVSGIVTILSPFAARWHAYALMVALFLRGVSQAFATPAMYKLINFWIPKNERGTLSTLMVCGMPAGVAIGGIVTGWLCDIPGFGWPSAFYIWGAVNVVFAFAVHFLCYEHPENHPYITEEELKYINDGLETPNSDKQPPTPWKKIFKSVPCYAYFYGLFGHYWSITYFTSTHPTFMGTVLHFPMTKNGVFSCLPVLMKSVGGVFSSILSHWITKKNLIGIPNLRKLTTGLGALGFSLSLAGAQLAGCDAMLNVLCFSLSLFFTGIALSGVMIAGVDMAPAFAGSIMGVSTSIANWSCVLIPVIAGLITTHEALSEWRIVFWLNFAVVGSSGIVYVLFGSAEVQPWNYHKGKPKVEMTTEERRPSAMEIQVKLGVF